MGGTGGEMVHMCAQVLGLSKGDLWGITRAPGRFGVPPKCVVGFYLEPTGLGKRMCSDV